MKPLPPALQIPLGLITGLALGGAMFYIGYHPVPIPLAGWIAIYTAIGIAAFFSLRRNLALFIVVAFLTYGFISLLTNHLLDTP